MTFPRLLLAKESQDLVNIRISFNGKLPFAHADVWFWPRPYKVCLSHLQIDEDPPTQFCIYTYGLFGILVARAVTGIEPPCVSSAAYSYCFRLLSSHTQRDRTSDNELSG